MHGAKGKRKRKQKGHLAFQVPFLHVLARSHENGTNGGLTDLSAENSGGGWSSFSYVAGINHFKSTTQLLANDPDGKGVNINASGREKFFVVGVDLQSHADGQIWDGVNNRPGHFDDYNDPEGVIIDSRSDITIINIGTK